MPQTSKSTSPISINLLDKEYRIACEQAEIEGLYQAARYLDQEMHRIRKETGLTGTERIAVLCALNLSSDYLACKKEKEAYAIRVAQCLLRIQDKIDGSLHPEEG